jgi:hypothetical protein
MTRIRTTEPQVFLSYTVKDRGIAEQIANALTQRGLQVVRDESALVAGAGVKADLTQALSQSAAVVPVLSGNSTRNTWVERELQTALHEVPLRFPVLLDSAGRASWVWPLVSHLQPVELRRSAAARKQDLELLANAVATAVLTPRPQKPSAPAPGQPVVPTISTVGTGARRR